MKTIRWGMIGCGDVTEVKSGPGFYKSEHSTLLGVTNRTLSKAHSYARRHGVPRVYPDAAALLADRDIDAVYISTPPNGHKALTLQAAAAGKHVYVEKPMAMNHAESQEMIAACQHAGVRLYVAFYRRAMPRFLKVKALLEQGVIGAVCGVGVLQRQKPAPEEFSRETLPWRVRGEISGGGKFLDMGVHVLDTLVSWFGPITEVHGMAGNRGGLYAVEDTVSASWRHAGGVLGAGNWCYVGRDDEDRIEITGTRGRIEFVFFDDSPLRIHLDGKVEEIDIPNPPHVQQALIQGIVNDLNGICPSPCDTNAAAMISAVMDTILGKSGIR
ncbi:MAG: Gfo/Idh/MocA family oxidoreductase [Candidatus Accumulibacter sp.]|jgi:predicted dehydrogenase|nr:Gfo/Idh/MocA family oxidoreductase [Accumulibacter sp.]